MFLWGPAVIRLLPPLLDWPMPLISRRSSFCYFNSSTFCAIFESLLFKKSCFFLSGDFSTPTYFLTFSLIKSFWILRSVSMLLTVIELFRDSVFSLFFSYKHLIHYKSHPNQADLQSTMSQVRMFSHYLYSKYNYNQSLY